MSTISSPIRIFGIGSPFGDDRLGWEVVAHLSHHPLLKNQDPLLWHASTCDRPGLHLLNSIEGATTVFLIDAIYSVQHVAGSMWHASAEEVLNQEDGSDALFSSHDLGVLQALELGHVLGLLPSCLRIFGIVTDKQDKWATVLSGRVAQALPGLVNMLAEEIHQAILGLERL